MVKVEGAKNFGIGLGLIVEDALFAVRLDFTIFQVEIECEGSIFLPMIKSPSLISAAL